MMRLDDYVALAEQAARAGGQTLLDWAGRFKVRHKGPADLVTEADLAAQEAVRAILLKACPGHGFLAEEDVSIPSREDDLRWIVDPLDGTINYVHGLPGYAVSIALEQRGRVLVGVVLDPLAQECFIAVAGNGAELNGRQLRASGATSLAEALVSVSFPAGVGRDDPTIVEFVEVLVRSRSMRRLGSAALNLCYVAAGRLDAYFAAANKSWDVAAGLLLVTEAGGVVTSYAGRPVALERPDLVAAATPALHAELVAAIGAAQRAPPLV